MKDKKGINPYYNSFKKAPLNTLEGHVPTDLFLMSPLLVGIRKTVPSLLTSRRPRHLEMVFLESIFISISDLKKRDLKNPFQFENRNRKKGCSKRISNPKTNPKTNPKERVFKNLNPIYKGKSRKTILKKEKLICRTGLTRVFFCAIICIDD